MTHAALAETRSEADHLLHRSIDEDESMAGLQRQLKLTNFFKRYVFNRRSKGRYITLVKLRETQKKFASKSSVTKNDVNKLCERFNGLNMKNSFKVSNALMSQ